MNKKKQSLKIDKIGILGAGNWGTVLSIIASAQVETVFLYDRQESRVQEINQHHKNEKYLPDVVLPKNIQASGDLKFIFSECKLILPVIPSSVFREFVQKFSSYTSGDHLLVHGTKGIESGTFKRMSEILVEETGCLRVGAISGPNIAGELASKKIGATVIASHFDEVIEAVQIALSSPYLRVYGNHDLEGVEWTGSFKNVLAIASGVLSELGFGQNALGLLLTRGFNEIRLLLSSIGANPETIFGLSGIGDVIATSTSSESRNFRAGILIAKGKKVSEIEDDLEMTIEGFNSIKVAKSLSKQYRLKTPIIDALDSILFHSHSTKDLVTSLMSGISKFE